MSHLPLPLMNRLNQIGSAVFKLWMHFFFRLFERSQQNLMLLCYVGALKSLPVHRFSIVISTFFVPLFL